MKKIAETGKMERLKNNWKKIAVSLIGLVGILYFVLTGEEVDLSTILGYLK